MRFEKTLTSSNFSGITKATPKGTYINDKGKISHHPRGKYSAHKDRPKRKIEFVGVDGEGMNVDGEHRYVLFGVGSRQIENPNGLSWDHVFRFLYDDFESRDNGRDVAYVGFFLGYDFTQIFKTLPEDRAKMLLTKEGQRKREFKSTRWGTVQNSKAFGMAPHPVEYQGWQFDILGMKRLKIRPKSCTCEVVTCKCKGKKPWMYICDVGGFFQTSFLKVIDPKGWTAGTQIVTEDEWNLILEGKTKRSVAVLDDDMRLYNRLENEVLARVMGTLRDGFEAIGVHLPPSKWFGPGQAAQTWLKNEGVPGREEIADVVPLRMFEAARASYFGGWFEIMMHGIIPGECHEYDINSAYPSIIATLPCLLHGTYRYGDGLPPSNGKNSYVLVYANLESPALRESWKHKDQYIGAMLHRERGQICRPMQTEGWYWWHELQAAQRVGLIKRLDNRGKQQIQKWIQYVPCDCPPPMANIAKLYEKRLEAGKTSPLGKAAKLLYNSGYGKFAQSEGLNPIFGNPIYASLITAGCRTMILDAISTHPLGKADVAMVATDAVYFLHPHPNLPISERLGEWDYKCRRNLTLFKPGVYWNDETRQRIADGKNPNFKARGFKADDFVTALRRIDEEFAEWNLLTLAEIEKMNRADMTLPGIYAKTTMKWPAVKFTPNFVLTSALQALMWNKWHLAGRVQDASTAKAVEQNSDPRMKRMGMRRALYEGRIVYRSMPHTFKSEPSEPYDKRFGMEDPWSEEAKAQMGETQEGRMMDILAWILNGD